MIVFQMSIDYSETFFLFLGNFKKFISIIGYSCLTLRKLNRTL